ncbi:Type 4 prepilin-like protein leader peptide-processing enzyme [Saliniradius amylolyticus]|uniref:Prepilin leader peptidase/N-methyltransferase n=1 Tax=Saliniradius amylolyticus TaxID=2183582 RepID=A0A2S2E5N4_9ALTE|nr:A24 family peptidase [Saliniradius amylolyticus]AWL12909.1 Type 4 prepilin-like protein leader peptide-processing enzyme [Saliniradius amylolyticus]
MTEILTLLEVSPAFLLSLIAFISLMVGSFLNVVIYRLPVMMEREWQSEYQSYFHDQAAETDNSTKPFNLVKPDSTCPHCHTPIKAIHNVPVLSWLFLKGRCAYCQTTIPARYPMVEALTTLLSVWVTWHLGYGPMLIPALMFTWLLIAMTFIDLDKMLLPDQLTLPLLWLGLIGSLYWSPVSPEDAILGAAAGYLSLWSIYWGFKLLTGKEGMGYGDFKLLAALGAWLGWQGLPVVILLSSLVGAIVGLSQIAFKGQDHAKPIPFGPYLAAAGWLAFLYGDWLTEQYWQWVLA